MNNLDKVVYQVYPKSFLDTNGDGIGDLGGIRNKLGYISSLGVDYLWISPISKSPQKDNGYDISDYYQIDKLFGTNDEYYKLIEESKEHGIGIILDLVLNHVSDQHEWFQKAISGNEYYQEFFIFRDEPNELISAFKKPAWTYCEALNKYYLHLFDASQPDLNWENENIRNELYKMINFWIKKGVKGFRLDVIDLIGKEPDKLIKAKGPNFVKYLEEMCNQTFKGKIFTVGECWGSSIEELNEMCSNNRLTQAFHFNHLLTTKKGNKWEHGQIDIKKLAQVIENYQNNYYGEEALVMNNHDLPRLNSFWLNDDEFVAESSKLLISLFGILRGTLYLYQGEEIGMTNAHFTDIAQYRDIETLNKFENDNDFNKSLPIVQRISRDNARTPMQWNDEEYGGFSTVTPWIDINENYMLINVEEQENNENSVLNYYRKVIAYRKANQDLINCKLSVEVIGQLLILKKESGLVGIYNFSKNKVQYKVNGKIIMNNYNEYNGTFEPYQCIIIESELDV